MVSTQTPNAPAGVQSRPPVLIELDPQFWSGQLDRAETFLGTVVLMQESFCTMVDDVLAKVAQPQYHFFLQLVSAEAHRHNASIKDFYRFIGREPAHGRAITGLLAAKGRQVLADVEGFMSGTTSPWRDLRQLWMSSHGAEGAFGVVEQVAYALGNKEMGDLAFTLVNEKHRSTLVIQEIVLEMAASAVLYDGNTEAQFGPRTSYDGPFLPDGN